MATIIAVSSNDHGTGIHRNLRKAFPEATMVTASLCCLSDLKALDQKEGTVIVTEFDRSSYEVRKYLTDKMSSLNVLPYDRS